MDHQDGVGSTEGLLVIDLYGLEVSPKGLHLLSFVGCVAISKFALHK
jgi:hypothetical protein